MNFKINATVFREIEIPIPPLEEQLKIEFLLDSIHFQLLNVEAKIQSSRSFQKV